MLFGVNFDVVSTSAVPQSNGVRPVDGASRGRPASQRNSDNRRIVQEEDSVLLSEKAQINKGTFKSQAELTDEEKREVEELKKTDREVRAHEQAHKSVGGQYVRGGASYEYKRGPDGQMYAVGGEVKIDVSEIPNDPEATIKKMQIVRRAALAPAEPSPQDRKVAAQASRLENKARAELTRQQAQEAQENASAAAEGNIQTTLPGNRAAISGFTPAGTYTIKPPENLFELFA